eukprot:1280327-Rhodomonas_salina.2
MDALDTSDAAFDTVQGGGLVVGVVVTAGAVVGLAVVAVAQTQDGTICSSEMAPMKTVWRKW